MSSGWLISAVPYLVTISLSASAGLLFGGMLSYGKVGELYNRLEANEAQLSKQGKLIEDLTEALKSLLAEYRNMGGNIDVGPAAVLTNRALSKI